MRINIEPVKTLFGKRNGSFLASFAGWTATDVDKERAAVRLQDKLQKLANNLYLRRYERANGATFVLYYADGWNYDIVRDSNVRQPSTCCLSCRTFTEALEQMTSHLKQWNECQ